MKAEFYGLLEEHGEGLRKPLYLQGQQSLTVDVDGPALRVEQPERAVMFYPLVRLARILSKGKVNWRHDALLACADRGIPVVFVDEDGGVRGYFFGRARNEHGLYHGLQASLKRGDGASRYRHWRTRMVAHAQWVLRVQGRRAGVAPDSVFLAPSVVATEKKVVQASPAIRLDGRLFGLLAGLSAQLWVEAGLNARRLATLESLPLVDDLARLLSWALVEPLLTASRTCVESGLDQCDDPTLTALVETRREDLFRFGRVLLDQLRQELAEG